MSPVPMMVWPLDVGVAPCGQVVEGTPEVQGIQDLEALEGKYPLDTLGVQVVVVFAWGHPCSLLGEAL